MPEYRKVNKLYKLCVQRVYKIIFRFCRKLEKQSISDKHATLQKANLFFVENLPKR